MAEPVLVTPSSEPAQPEPPETTSQTETAAEKRLKTREQNQARLEEAAEKRKIEREAREEEREREKKKRDKAEREKEEAEKKKKKEIEAQEKKYQPRRKHELDSLKQGLELPKYGMGRISSGPKQLASGNLLGKGVNFSGQLGQFNPGNIGSFNRGKMRIRFPKMTISAKGFQDPFAGMKMFPGSKRPGRKPKGSLFSLGLFRKR